MGDAAGEPTAGGGDWLPDCRLPTILRPVECFVFGEASTDTTGPLAQASWSVPVGDSDASSDAPATKVAKDGVADDVEAGEDTENKEVVAEEAMGTQEFNVTGESDSVFVASSSKALKGVSVVDGAGAHVAAVMSAFVSASMLVAVSFASTSELFTAADLASASLASATALAAAEAWSGAAKT